MITTATIALKLVAAESEKGAIARFTDTRSNPTPRPPISPPNAFVPPHWMPEIPFVLGLSRRDSRDGVDSAGRHGLSVHGYRHPPFAL